MNRAHSVSAAHSSGKIVHSLFTIGHSNHSWESFLALIQSVGVEAIADVRSHPYSRRYPHFSQKILKPALQQAGIQYVFLGKELGARPKDRTCYQDGKAVYGNIAATERFQHGIQRLKKGATQYRIALFCAEQDPLTCHRTILICPHLKQDLFAIQHIHKSGELESQAQLEARLLATHDLQPDETGQLSLFASDTLNRDALLQQAYQLQGDRIAYTDPQENAHG